MRTISVLCDRINTARTQENSHFIPRPQCRVGAAKPEGAARMLLMVIDKEPKAANPRARARLDRPNLGVPLRSRLGPITLDVSMGWAHVTEEDGPLTLVRQA